MTKLPPRTESELVELVRSSDVRAPDSLHRHVEALVATHPDPARRRRFAARAALPRPRFSSFSALRPRHSRLGSIAVAAAAAVIVAVVAIALAGGLGGGGSTTLSMRQAAAPLLSAATMPAPPESRANRAKLAAAVDDVKFPYWEERFGWRSTGMRSDRIGGRTVTTVFYADARGHRVGYAIVAGTPAPRVGGGVTRWRDGVSYRMLSEDGVAVVTWLRDGRLCLVSGRGVSGATLLKLASWSDRNATAA